MVKKNYKVAKVGRMKRFSPIWTIPVLTALIGLWIIIYYFMTQGPALTLVTDNAEGIIDGKTAIKSRSVDIGIVEQVNLSGDLNKVIIKARLNRDMNDLLKEDSVFWVVKPQIGRDGVSGLGTLLSGAYIELSPGKSATEKKDFRLLDSPPISSPDTKGVRLTLVSKQSGVLGTGDPVLFRGVRVGSIESHNFDTEKRAMTYKLFINAPFDKLVTSNVRFWQDSGFTFDISAEGMKIGMSSLQTLVSGGVSFDIPNGWTEGEAVSDGATYELFSDRSSIQESIYTRHENFIVLFNDSIRGLSKGAPVELKGIRVGTVIEVPHYLPGMWNDFTEGPNIPILISIEPERIQGKIETIEKLHEIIANAQKHGFRAALKSGNLLTGALYVDLDFYENAKEWVAPPLNYDYPVIASVSAGLSQLQQKLMTTLDKINNLPVEATVNELNQTLRESQSLLKNMNDAMSSVDKLLADKHTQTLPANMQKSLIELNKTLKGLQPGSPAYRKMVDDMNRLDDLLREMQPLVQTLNSKSNALVFEASQGKDPQPKGAK